MKSKKIPPELKSKIISESLKPGCVTTKLASKYGISRTIIYNWRSKYKKSSNFSAPSSVLKSPSRIDEFVELSVIEKTSPVLQEAYLKFNDFSFDMQGQIKSSTLVSIIKVLEESC